MGLSHPDSDTFSPLLTSHPSHFSLTFRSKPNDRRDKAGFANLLAFQNVNHIAGTGIEYSLLGRTVFLERRIP